MDTIEPIKEILAELLDVAPGSIAAHSYLVRDLDVESIDFLELAVTLNERFGVPVEDDTVFLRNLRLHLAAAQETSARPRDYLRERYPFLSPERIRQILSDLDGGPVIQVQDLASYVQWQMTASQAA